MRSGEIFETCFTQVGDRRPWPYIAWEPFTGLVAGTCRSRYISKKMQSSALASGTSSPSIHTTVSPVSLPWSCHCQLGVRMRSPSRMTTFSPSTAV